MTGGQVSPETPMGDYATTAPYGAIENNFNIAELVVAAGASYVARCTSYHANLLGKLIEKAIEKKGFSLVEIMTPDQKNQAVRIEKARTMSPEELQNKIIIGTLIDRELPEYTNTYERVIYQAQNI